MPKRYAVEITWLVNDYGNLRRDTYEVDSLAEIDDILTSKGPELLALDEILIWLNLPKGRTTLADAAIDYRR